MKQFWGIPAMALAAVIIIVLSVQFTPHTELLPNEAPGGSGDAASSMIPNDASGGSGDAASSMIPDEDVPLSQGVPEPSALYEGLDETERSYVNEVLRLVNEARVQNNLAPLRLDEGLRKASQVRSAECVNVFSHTRPNGSSYKTAVAEAGVISDFLGENAATGQATPQEVVQAWMDSEGHRANILYPYYTRLGIGLSENNGNPYKGYAWIEIFSNG